ncbi:HNH endonuclease family protein [Allonocardiopsis opalescens]|uniref:Uncharacterized protein DUF1524 n=1 Tax=Allonocardiopsis opalescens TaxID=1144618 RepID=A0A2T0QAG3_9ACTN|nr:HNH endonuclease family protein [Allonocardiopsis opalescens]PRY00844.1 uncharacterized protein DUF1524 [Allonocardiopsis opalescens]
MRRVQTAVLAVLAAAALLFGMAAPAAAAPPTPPSAATARSQLAALTTEAEGSSSPYDRDLFPHWSPVSGNCNARETVLRRDGTNVTVGNDCYPTSGSWYSPYDGVTLSSPSQVQIDHMIPLAEAWRSGADTWSTARREDFANDLATAQLWAVSGSSNQSKSDQDPAEWMPTRSAVHCLYARAWVNVKYVWRLSVDSAERSALTSILNRC